MATALNYGPYYLSSIRKAESQKKALGGRAYTPEELAGLAYGELSSKYEQARATKKDQDQLSIQQQYLDVAKTGQVATLRSQRKAEKATERGNIVSGIATGVNVLDKVGALKWGGDVLKTGAKAITTPATDYGVTEAGYGATGLGGSDYPSEFGGYDYGGYDYTSGVDYASTAYDFYNPDYYTTTTDTFATAASGGTVICTELYRQGLLDEKTYLADSAYGTLLDDEVLTGYKIWGERVARLMGKSKLFTKIVSVIAIPWAKEMAYQMKVLNKGHWLGKVMNIVGIPICRVIGRLMIKGGSRWQEVGWVR